MAEVRATRVGRSTGSPFTARHTSKPGIMGSMASRMTSSGRASRMRSSAARPLAACSTVQPCFLAADTASSRSSGTASATSTRKPAPIPSSRTVALPSAASGTGALGSSSGGRERRAGVGAENGVSSTSLTPTTSMVEVISGSSMTLSCFLAVACTTPTQAEPGSGSAGAWAPRQAAAPRFRSRMTPSSVRSSAAGTAT